MNALINRGAILAIVVAIGAGSAAGLDTDSGNVSDVWEAHHAYGPLIATADDDGDGLNNLLEYYFNLNPFIADAHYLSIEFISGTQVEIAFLAPFGQRFQYQRNDDLLGGEWVDLIDAQTQESIFTGSGNMETYEEDPTAIQKAFFRVTALGALDQDGDRLDAHEEHLIGTSDTTPDSEPGGGDGMRDDYEYLNALDPLVDDAGADKDSDGVINSRDSRPNDATEGQVSIVISYPSEGVTVN